MAEAIARWLIEQGRVPSVGPEVFVASAGVAAGEGIPISEEAVMALARLGIEHDGTSKRLTPEMVRRASAVVGMTGGHVAEIRRMLGPAGSGEVVRVDRFDPASDVDDPVGMGVAAYDRLATQFVRQLPRRIPEWLRS